jgi:antitoxin FitA
MGAIHVEGIEERVLKSIALRAERNGRSLDEELRAILEAAAGTDTEPAKPEKNWLEQLDEIRAMTPKGVQQTDSTEIIRELRDRGHERAARADRIRAMTKGSSPETESVTIIREMRDREH